MLLDHLSAISAYRVTYFRGIVAANLATEGHFNGMLAVVAYFIKSK
jgi:hypothetical protein